MSKKIIKYLYHFGIKNTFKKIKNKILKILGFKKSETYFLEYKIRSFDFRLEKNQNININILDKSLIKEYNEMKYFDFIKTEKWFENINKIAIIAMNNENIIGYVWLDLNNKHYYGLGNWKLLDDEAWIGPVYVVKKWRGNGINSYLLKWAANYLRNRKYNKIYTSINSGNIASIKSFTNNDYKVIGRIKIRKLFNFLISEEKLSFKDKVLENKLQIK